MLTNFALDQKSLSKLATKGLCAQSMQKQINEEISLQLELWRAQGLSIIEQNGYYFFETKFTKIEDATFCIVDIETNGSKPNKHQIIEIAALKVKDAEIIDRFESLVYCSEINAAITDLTGITPEDTKDAPLLEKVISDFKIFLGDSIFVAHDVKFDYRFISTTLEKFGLAPLLNRSLCTLALAQRTIVSYKYGLGYLNNFFHLNPDASHHRAMSDVITTYELFKLTLQNLSKDIESVEDLIRFSREEKMLKRPLIDPLLAVDEKKEESSLNS